jgi:arylsulfatase A-like enzyme
MRLQLSANGKWHMAGEGLEPWDFAPPPLAPGRPNAQGCDYFFGTPMHNGYTEVVDNQRFIVQLMRNSEVVESPTDVNLLIKKYTQETNKFIRQHKDTPFFFYLSHNMPHVSLGASEAFKDKSSRGLYGDAIEELDWSMGQILEELTRLHLELNTLVIFTSDNGRETQANLGGNNGDARPLRGGKYSNWEGGIRVPAIKQWQGRIPEGVVSEEIATTMDFFPTFMELAGGALPKDRVIDGKDISSLMFARAGARSPHRSFYYYSLTKLQAVRSGRWKLVLPRKLDSPHMLR